MILGPDIFSFLSSNIQPLAGFTSLLHCLVFLSFTLNYFDTTFAWKTHTHTHTHTIRTHRVGQQKVTLAFIFHGRIYHTFGKDKQARSSTITWIAFWALAFFSEFPLLSFVFFLAILDTPICFCFSSSIFRQLFFLMIFDTPLEFGKA